MTTHRRTAAALVVAAVALVGCSADDDPATTTEPLTREQAAQLAEVLVDNLDDGGAAFVVSARTAGGDTITLTGEVDWVGHTGRATVDATGPEAGLDEIVWTDSAMFERRPALAATLRDQENLAVDWILRPPAPATRTIDKLVAIIAALAGEQVDNAVLIAQEPGSASLGTVEIDGRDAELLRYGERNRYSLATDTGELLRFEQPPVPGNDAIVIDFSDRGPRTVELPSGGGVIAVEALGDRYPGG